jgi:2-dehydropantoate 2-reductase
LFTGKFASKKFGQQPQIPDAGIDLRPEEIEEWEQVMMTLSPTGKTSMLQDVEAGRKTEVEIFAGRVVALGEKYAVPTPVNATVQRIIRVIEGGFGR